MDSVKICPKCDAGRIERDIGIPITGWPVRWHGIGIKADGTYTDEALVRTCTRCRYEWEESCVGA